MKFPTSLIIVLVNTAILFAVNIWVYAQGGSPSSYSLIWDAIVASGWWLGTVTVIAICLGVVALAEKGPRRQLAPFAWGFLISLPILVVAFLPAWFAGIEIGGKLSGY
ncbi:hypothetical protein [Asticcacaulis sp. AC460]|uniref:hypothetical protein n=1 Tax=Asticcacaulis sp. AC460 TaxID=1282360 RepID=UPI0012DE7E8D|nr:hypothetical protein [Asticcacaulis sp. AC460]